ncbi:MAG TPA: hypothetical protein VEQ66_02785 [Propionibacteriaceae bacterium]|nr:hypothetical protein [Propionibacteriaceae bacterium]
MDGFERLRVGDWELLRLTTDQLTVDLVPQLGGTIVSLRRRVDDAELLWQTPWGLRPRGSLSLPGSSEAVMLDTYPGGWQSLFPNAGDTAIVHGVEWGYDGETRLAPFSWTAVTGSVVLTARLVRSPFEVTKVISVRGGEVKVAETVTNVGGEALEVMWGQQVVLGPPLVSAHTVVDADATTVHPDPAVTDDVDYEDVMPWPRSYGNTTYGHSPYGSPSVINLRNLPGPEGDETRLAYLTDFARARVSVRNADADLGLDLEWDGGEWPHLWYSMEAGRRAGFPWFNKGYFFSLTPSTSWPGHGMHDARRVAQTTRWVQPDESCTAQLTVRVHSRR